MRNTFIWGSSWRASQQAPHETSISNSRMACSRQASNALRQHFALARRIDYRVWPINSTIPWPYLRPIQNSGASTRDCSMKAKTRQTTICCITCGSPPLVGISTPPAIPTSEWLVAMSQLQPHRILPQRFHHRSPLQQIILKGNRQIPVLEERKRGWTYLPSSSTSWETMFDISVYLGQQIHTQRSWYMNINLVLYRLYLLTTGRTCPSTCEEALWPHEQKECHPANRQEIHPAASFS